MSVNIYKSINNTERFILNTGKRKIEIEFHVIVKNRIGVHFVTDKQYYNYKLFGTDADNLKDEKVLEDLAILEVNRRTIEPELSDYKQAIESNDTSVLERTEIVSKRISIARLQQLSDNKKVTQIAYKHTFKLVDLISTLEYNQFISAYYLGLNDKEVINNFQDLIRENNKDWLLNRQQYKDVLNHILGVNKILPYKMDNVLNQFKKSVQSLSVKQDQIFRSNLIDNVLHTIPKEIELLNDTTNTFI